MKAVFRVVYSKDEDIVGIERTFPFNYDVIISEDAELKSILRELSNKRAAEQSLKDKLGIK